MAKATKKKAEETSKSGPKLKYSGKKLRVNVMLAPEHKEAISKDYDGVSEFLEEKAEQLIKKQGKRALMILLLVGSMASCRKDVSTSCLSCVTTTSRAKHNFMEGERSGTYTRDTGIVCGVEDVYTYQQEHSSSVYTADSAFITTVNCK